MKVEISDELNEVTQDGIDYFLGRVLEVNENSDSPNVDDFIDSFCLNVGILRKKAEPEEFKLELSPDMLETKPKKQPKTKRVVKPKIKHDSVLDWVEQETGEKYKKVSKKCGGY